MTDTRDTHLSWREAGLSRTIDDDGSVPLDFEAETPHGTYVLRAVDEIFTRRFAGYVVSFRPTRGPVRHLTERAKIRRAKSAKEIALHDYRQRVLGRAKRRERRRRPIATRKAA
jgi:hypothetical protein